MRGREIYKRLLTILREGERAAVVSRFEAGKIAKRLVREGDTAEWAALPATADPLSFAQDEHALTLTEYYAPGPRLLILGGGHIALALSAMGALIDFDVIVFDDRPIFANAERFPQAREVICDSFVNVMDRLKIRQSDYVVIVTRGHRHDTLCLRGVLSGPLPCYIGMIGSRRRVAIVRKQLADEGFSPADIAKVYSPIGLRIGAVTPQEISISILAEIVQHRRKGPAWASDAEAAATRTFGASDIELAQWLADEKNGADALITVVETHGSTPREAGAKMAVSYEGAAVGTIGGGCAEAGVMQDARSVIRNGGYSLKTVDLTDSAEEDGMVCGGSMTILTEALRPAP
ncbi:MAG: XdhC family protein [Clostridiales Family XIII bacterium]|jgi:xanthine dehydrogenase accessory factor|nr:XdhC family protein [Clostridiales Family XIII bacterium]